MKRDVDERDEDPKTKKIKMDKEGEEKKEEEEKEEVVKDVEVEDGMKVSVVWIVDGSTVLFPALVKKKKSDGGQQTCLVRGRSYPVFMLEYQPAHGHEQTVSDVVFLSDDVLFDVGEEQELPWFRYQEGDESRVIDDDDDGDGDDDGEDGEDGEDGDEDGDDDGDGDEDGDDDDQIADMFRRAASTMSPAHQILIAEKISQVVESFRAELRECVRSKLQESHIHPDNIDITDADARMIIERVMSRLG